RPQRVQPERVGEPPAELEDVPDLDAAPDLQRSRAAGARVAGPYVGRLDRAVGLAVAAARDVDGVPVRLVGAGEPAAGGRDPRGGVATASTFAAYPQAWHETYVPSPTGDVARNSSLALPPIAPAVADTIV